MGKEYGGYLPFQIEQHLEYYPNAGRYSCGRAAIAAALEIKRPLKVYTPLYMCESLIDVYKHVGIEYEYYNLDENFLPIGVKVNTGELILWPYYYGAILPTSVESVIERYRDRLILDNTQAFFYKSDCIMAIYSCRKFFGVPDGGYLCSQDRQTDRQTDRQSRLIVICIFSRLLKKEQTLSIHSTSQTKNLWRKTTGPCLI